MNRVFRVTEVNRLNGLISTRCGARAAAIGLVLLLGSSFVQAFLAVPAKPFDLRSKTRFEGAVAVVTLTWRDLSDNELGFEVQRSDSGKEFKEVGMVGANTTRFEDRLGKYVTGSFQYRVVSFNQEGRSEPTNTTSVWF